MWDSVLIRARIDEIQARKWWCILSKPSSSESGGTEMEFMYHLEDPDVALLEVEEFLHSFSVRSQC